MIPLQNMRTILQKAIIVFALALLGCDEKSGVEHGNVSIDLSPDGAAVVFSSADGDLFLFTIETESVIRLTKTDAIESVPSFSPDGKSIVYAAVEQANSSSNICTLNLTNNVSSQLTRETKQSDFLPHYSPDGKKIVFGRAYRNRPYSMGGTTWDNWDVCEMDAKGDNVKRLTNENYYKLSRMIPKADGSIIYSAGVKMSLYTLSKSGQVIRTFPESDREDTKANAWASDVMISPDESKIAFTSDRTRAFWYDVCVSADGKHVNGLIGNKSRYNRYPDFSPDGQRIIFMAGTKFNNGSRAIFSLWEVSTSGKSREIASDDLFTDPLNYNKESAE